MQNGTLRKFDGRLLLMPCSATKLDHADQPRRLYLGPMWQTLREHLGDMPWENVFVLSGEYGFISSLNFIQTYDGVLTSAKADRMIARGVEGGNDHHGASSNGGPCPSNVLVSPGRKGQQPFDRVLCAGANDYRRVLQHFIAEWINAGLIKPDARIFHVVGGIGEQRQQLGRWLRKEEGFF